MKCVLKDLIAISKDGEWGKGEPFDDSVEMLAIRGTDFKDVRFGFTASTPRRYIAKRHADRKRLQPWDVLIEVAGGTKNQITGRTVLLRPQLFSCSELPFICASFSRFIRFNTDLCDPEFMFWYLQHLYTSGFMHAYHTQHTGVARFQWTTFSEREPLELPPLPVQRRIAGILSSYDELIENSQRRIRILETMARALYREWFVHFRFPGHENHPRVPSQLGEIPARWEFSTLGKHLSALESGKRPKGGIRDVEDGVPSIGAENINGVGQHNFNSEKFVPRAFFDEIRKGVVRDGDVAIYKDGAYIGRSSYFRDAFPHAECCVNEHVFLLRSDGVRLTQNALYLWLQESDTVHAIRATNSNAAQPGINQRGIKGLELLLPDERTAEHFDRVVEPLFAELIVLAKRIENLRWTRDLLLPRLLSGRLELELA